MSNMERLGGLIFVSKIVLLHRYSILGIDRVNDNEGKIEQSEEPENSTFAQPFGSLLLALRLIDFGIFLPSFG